MLCQQQQSFPRSFCAMLFTSLFLLGKAWQVTDLAEHHSEPPRHVENWGAQGGTGIHHKCWKKRYGYNVVLVDVQYRHTMAYLHHPQYCRFPSFSVSLLSPKSFTRFEHLGIPSLTFKRVKRVYTLFYLMTHGNVGCNIWNHLSPLNGVIIPVESFISPAVVWLQTPFAVVDE